MKRILLMTIVALSWCVCSLAGSVSKYDAGGVPDIHPTGWEMDRTSHHGDGTNGNHLYEPRPVDDDHAICQWRLL